MKRGAILFPLAAWLLFAQSGVTTGHRYPSPVDVKLSPDGSTLYVLCQGTEELLALNTSTNAITGRVKLGSVPRGLALARDGRRAWVTNSWADSVSELDTVSMTVTRVMKTGFEPSGVAADGREEFLYVGNRITNDVSVIDLASGQEARRLVAGRGASYVTPSPDGSRIFVSHIYPNFGKFRTEPQSEITAIDTAQRVVEDRYRLPNAAGVFEMAFTADGKVGIAAELRPKNLPPLAHVAHGFAFADAITVFGDGIGEPVQLPLDDLESHFSLPFGVAISGDGRRAYVALRQGGVAILDITRRAGSPPASSAIMQSQAPWTSKSN